MIARKNNEFLVHFDEIFINNVSEILFIFKEAFNQLEQYQANLHLVLPLYFTIKTYLADSSYTIKQRH